MKKWIFLLFYISVIFAENSHEKGRQYFQMYCSACHGLSYGAVNTLQKPALSEEDALKWFGRPPPDLSLVTLKYSKSWLVTYLTGFYPDEAKRFGSNNHLMPNVMMPNVFASQDKNDKINLEKIASDIADYLDDVSQPERHQRYQLGILVCLWCLVAVVLSAMLSKIYKK